VVVALDGRLVRAARDSQRVIVVASERKRCQAGQQRGAQQARAAAPHGGVVAQRRTKRGEARKELGGSRLQPSAEKSLLRKG
jgi:hypothetical protein